MPIQQIVAIYVGCGILDSTIKYGHYVATVVDSASGATRKAMETSSLIIEYATSG